MRPSRSLLLLSLGLVAVGVALSRAPAHAEKTEAAQNELLEHQHGNYLDTGAQGQAGRADRKLEAVATRHRAAHA